MNPHLHCHQHPESVLLFEEEKKLARVDKKLTTEKVLKKVFLQHPATWRDIFFNNLA